MNGQTCRNCGRPVHPNRFYDSGVIHDDGLSLCGLSGHPYAMAEPDDDDDDDWAWTFDLVDERDVVTTTPDARYL